jgi:hypothetical protein
LKTSVVDFFFAQNEIADLNDSKEIRITKIIEASQDKQLTVRLVCNFLSLNVTIQKRFVSSGCNMCESAKNEGKKRHGFFFSLYN